MNKLVNSLKFFYTKPRKAKYWRAPHYEAVPYYMRPMKKDEHEYPLRPFNEVVQELDSLHFEIDFKYEMHANNRYPFDDNESKVVATINLHEFNLSVLQKKRMILLLGPRYKGSDRVNIACDSYSCFDQNTQKLEEMIEELLLEAKRAPGKDYRPN